MKIDWGWFVLMWAMRALSAAMVAFMTLTAWSDLGWVIAGDRGLYAVGLGVTVVASGVNMWTIHRSVQNWMWRGERRTTKRKEPG